MTEAEREFLKAVYGEIEETTMVFDLKLERPILFVNEDTGLDVDDF